MGAQQSADVANAVDQVDQQLRSPQQEGSGIKLYKFVKAGATGGWEKVTENCSPSFYNINEDSGKLPDYHLEIDSEDLDVRVDNNLSYIVDLPGRRITFQAQGSCWALKFGSVSDFKSFSEDLNDKSFFNMYGVENGEEQRSKELGADYAGVFFTYQPQVEPMDVDAEGDEPVPTPERLSDETAKETQDAISGIVMGALDNNFLLQGSRVDVMRNVAGRGMEDAHVSFSLAALTPKGTPQGGPVTPSRVLLAQGERKMMVLTPDQRTALTYADIETTKVVSTWTFQKDGCEIPMDEISHDTKSSGMENRSTFLGLAQNRLCRWDLRDPSGVVNQSPVVGYLGGKDYARNTNFTCMATSGDGYVVVGAEDGKIRLYSDKSLTQAKTAIPGLGAAITAVDVTYDGKWVLVTTDHYLMVVKTTYTDDKGRAANGFTSRMGARGTVPRLLRLRPEDVARSNGKPFSKGKFTWVTESGTTEQWIAASCGCFAVVWNFRRVKNTCSESVSFGGLPTSTDYLITMKDEEVVDSAFVHSRYTPTVSSPSKFSTSMVVATPHRLFNVS